MAVAAVVAYHLGYLPGGFLGVDVFFVLSGYLITSLLVAEAESSDRIDVRAFWARRIRRLVPAVLVLVPVVLGGALVMRWPSTRLDALGGDAAATMTWWANWRQVVSAQSYWAPAPSPFRHAWSLSIEEQFYLAWPVVVAGSVWLARRRRWSVRTTVGRVAAAAALAGLAWHVTLAHRLADADLSRVYLGTDTRVLAVLTGCALACSRWGIGRGSDTVATRVAGVLGGLTLVVLTATVHVSDPWLFRGGGFGLVAVSSAALVALVGTAESAATTRAALHPSLDPPWARTAIGAGGAWAGSVLGYLGTRSYGLYLWSWPVQVLVAQRWPSLGKPTLAVVVLAVALAAAEVSYRFVEQPIRRSQGWAAAPRRRRPAWAGAGALAVGLVLLASMGSTPPPAHERIDTAQAVAMAVRRPPPTPRPIGQDAAARRDLRVLVIGDSVAFTVGYYVPADDDLPPGIASIDSRSVIGCGVLAAAGWEYELDEGGFAPPSGGDCVGQAEGEKVGLRGEPDVVVMLPGAWEAKAVRSPSGSVVPGRSPEMAQLLVSALVDRAVAAHAVDARFVLVEWACPAAGTPSPRGDADYIGWVNGLLHEAARVATTEHQAPTSVLPAGAQTCTGGPTGEPTRDKASFMGASNHVLGFPEGRHLWWSWLGPALADEAHRSPS